MSQKASTDQFLEIYIDPGKFYVRIDLDHKNVTTGFKAWLSWDVDTVQQVVSRNIIHFIEPNGQIVGIKTFSLDIVLSRGVDNE